MDSAVTAARLEWWANRWTCFGAFSVSVNISVDEQGWAATGQLAQAEEYADVAALCEFDEAFELRFPDDSTVGVLVSDLTRTGSFTLTEVR
ncbi:hypothetical protein [Kribbella sp. NPDC051770]|uniref:hypothetical protein n=1 Tax=Kribbella sp. NPDC051770 TaxID=3155413 RepID=UPI003416D93F